MAWRDVSVSSLKKKKKKVKKNRVKSTNQKEKRERERVGGGGGEPRDVRGTVRVHAVHAQCEQLAALEGALSLKDFYLFLCVYRE